MLNRTENPITAWSNFTLSQVQTVKDGAVAPVVTATAHKATTRVLGDESGKPLEVIPGGPMLAPMGGQIDQAAVMAILNQPTPEGMTVLEFLDQELGKLAKAALP